LAIGTPARHGIDSAIGATDGCADVYGAGQGEPTEYRACAFGREGDWTVTGVADPPTIDGAHATSAEPSFLRAGRTLPSASCGRVPRRRWARFCARVMP
jgi:hypothetical protein